MLGCIDKRLESTWKTVFDFLRTMKRHFDGKAFPASKPIQLLNTNCPDCNYCHGGKLRATCEWRQARVNCNT